MGLPNTSIEWGFLGCAPRKPLMLGVRRRPRQEMENRIDMRGHRGAAFMFAILLATVTMAEVPEAILVQAWYPKAPPLPEPAGQVVRVSSVHDIYRVAENLQ